MTPNLTVAGGESHHLDRKSLRKVTGSTADFADLAHDCGCFANGAGGTLLIGIGDGAAAPPGAQRVDHGLLDRIRKRVGELIWNVTVLPELKRHENNREYIALTVPRSVGGAEPSTPGPASSRSRCTSFAQASRPRMAISKASMASSGTSASRGAGRRARWDIYRQWSTSINCGSREGWTRLGEQVKVCDLKSSERELRYRVSLTVVRCELRGRLHLGVRVPYLVRTPRPITTA